MNTKNRRKNVIQLLSGVVANGSNRYHYKLKKTQPRRVSSIFAFALVAAVTLFQAISPQGAVAATGDVTAVRISASTIHKGWVAEIDMEGMAAGGTYNMGFTPSTAGNLVDANANIKFTVTSPGYDAAGNATTTTRTVYGTNFLRQPYPNQSLADETIGAGIVTLRVALSEFIYAGETVTADIGAGFYTASSVSNSAATGVTVVNNSTSAYPKPVGRWAWPPYERVKSDFLLEAVAFHRFGRDAKPLAAVKFTCTDESTNSVTMTVNDMTVSTREDSANTGSKVLVYAATIPITSFTQGDVITCNFVAYPWVGDSSSVLNSDLVANGGDGFAQPDERLGPLALLNDKDGTYGEPCAIVSSTGQASNLSTWVYPSCAQAEAAYAGDNTLAYADIGRAAQAIRSYNNTNHGHNDPGGGTIELLAQNYSTPGTAPSTTLGTQETWLTIQPASTVPCHTPVINANSNNDLMAQKLKYSCLSTSTTTGNTFRGDIAYNDILWLDRMKLNSTEPAPIRYWDTMYATGNTVDALTNGFSGLYAAVMWPSGLVRGNHYTLLDTTTALPLYGLLNTVIGNKNIIPKANFTDGVRNLSDNSIYAFNTVLNSNNSNPEIHIHSTTASNFTHGIAIVQNVIEATLSAQPVVAIENMGGTDSISNLIFWHNTTRGQRSNVAYASDSAHCSEPLPYFTNWRWKYNIESNHNHIDEVRSDHGCPADGGRIGNWSMNYSVGGAGNARAVGSGPSWSQPDYLGLFSVGVPSVAGFVSDLSSTEYGGAGGGGGDYRLTASSSLRNVIPSNQAVLPYDLDGSARYNTGQGAIGGYEFSSADATAPVVTTFTVPPTSSTLNVSGITLTASDDVAVSGYMITESSTAPAAADGGWTVTAPTDYTFATYGSKTLYAWAKDAAGNVSLSASDTVEVTEPAPTTYTIGGTTSGLAGTVVLQNNGGDDLSVSTGTFTFGAALVSGAAYDVSVLTQPTGQTCTVSDGSGAVANANVTNVTVSCSNNPTPTHTIGGTTNGLTGTVVLQNNGGDNLSVTAGTFIFDTSLSEGATYNVTVLTQPAGQTCAVTDSSGTVATADITDINVTCTNSPVPTYTIGGTTSGLTGTVVLQDNGGDNLSVNTGSFTFGTALISGAAYNVSVLTQPAGQSCTVSNGSGVVASSNINNVVVTCANVPGTITDTVELNTIPSGDNQATNNALRNGILSVSSTSCYTLDDPSVETYAVNGITAPDQNVALIGGIAFRVTCITNGGTANVELLLDAHYADVTKLRVYKQLDSTPGAALTDITDQITFTTTTVDGATKTVINYALTDGGQLDEDGASDGSIVDPIYIGEVLAATTVDDPPSTATDSLAQTGANIFSAVAVSVMAILLAVLKLRVYARQ